MYWVTDIQTSVSAADPEVSHELALAPLGHSLEAPGEYWLKQLITYFVEIKSSMEKF